MKARKHWLTAFVALAIVGLTLPALAQDEFSFAERKIKTVFPGRCDFVTCAAVAFTPPDDGYVVVTASGTSLFSNDVSFLELTLSTKPAARGPWLFDLTPGFNLVQAYTVRMVFPVEAGTPSNFYLNGRSCRGPGGRISVETGSITAEFHPSSETQQQPALAAPELEPSTDTPTINRH